MNKKFLALSMLMFASWSGSLMSMGGEHAVEPVAGAEKHVSFKPNQELVQAYEVDPAIQANAVQGMPEANVVGAKSSFFGNIFRSSNRNSDSIDMVTAEPQTIYDQNGKPLKTIESKTTKDNESAQSSLSLADLANSARSGLVSGAQAAYNAPGRLAQAMGHSDGKIITGETGSLSSGLSFADAQAQNLGSRLGIPNLTGRSRDITNIDAKAKNAIESRFQDFSEDPVITENNDSTTTKTFTNQSGDKLAITKNNDGTTSEIYTPAPNFAVRQIRALYNSLPTLTTAQGRQAFKDSVSAMFKSSGKAEPSSRSWSEFFASLTPNMSFSMFSKSVTEKLDPSSSENGSEVSNPLQQSPSPTSKLDAFDPSISNFNSMRFYA